MKIKRNICGMMALSMILTLAACGADNEPTSESKASEALTSSMTETTPKVESEPQDENIIDINAIDDSSIPGITITVDTISYVDEMLTFVYEGEEYTLPLSRDGFVDDSYWWPGGRRTVSERVINNRLGEVVKAEMKVSEDITKIYKCDIINQNGKMFHVGLLDDDPEDMKKKKEDPEAWRDYAYTLTRIDGTKYELSNIKRTLSVDLNDLDEYEKIIYPDNEFDVSFEGYLFEDGQFIISELRFLVDRDESHAEYSNRTNLDFPRFFGTVQSCDGETAEVMLNDGVTVVNVPTYYCEEELSPEKEVMIVLDCGTDLFGSGESKTFDYAVIYTDPKVYNYDNHDFSTLAYATSSEYTLGQYDYVFIDEVQP